MADARKEVTPQGYPSPQVELNTARDIGSPAAPQQSTAPAAPDKNAGAIDAQFVEVIDKPEPAKQSFEPPEPGRKIGEGHLMGMLRLGAHELTTALQALPDSNIRPQEEPGVFGNVTPQIVSEQMGYDPTEFVRGNAPEKDRGRSR